MHAGEPDAFGSPYRFLSGAIIPRPIAWTSSRGENGVDNLAPFSFFNMITYDPPVVMFAPQETDEGPKDTARNVRETEEFVVHIVTRELAEAMNETSATLEYGESEFEHAGLDRVEADRVDAARIADAKVALECELYETVEVGVATMILGEVVYTHVHDDLLTDGKFDTRKFHPIGRLAGGLYCATDERFKMERPP